METVNRFTGTERFHDAMIRSHGQVVGKTDRIYELPDAGQFYFEEIEVKGDISAEPLDYCGKKIQIQSIDIAAAFFVDERGSRGPIWKGVRGVIL
ncbi:hypothetical protein LBMAG21_16040 [Armatimonadota bacterium]|nr:hypothetical protein LBMAG21_16040 [Armatimonadota bacterium]